MLISQSENPIEKDKKLAYIPSFDFGMILASNNVPFRLWILVGLPAAGKTTLSNAIIQHVPGSFRVNQDELKMRKNCENHLLRHIYTLKPKPYHEAPILIVDRCNFDKSQRKVWIELAHSFGGFVEVIFINLPLKVCAERAKYRKDHPSGVHGEYAYDIIARFDTMFVAPDACEGQQKMVTISIEDPLMVSTNEGETFEYSDEDISAFVQRVNETPILEHDSCGELCFTRRGAEETAAIMKNWQTRMLKLQGPPRKQFGP